MASYKKIEGGSEREVVTCVKISGVSYEIKINDFRSNYDRNKQNMHLKAKKFSLTMVKVRIV